MSNNISSSNLIAKRPRCLVFGMILQFMLGLNYAFSVFQLPLMEQFDAPLSTISLLSSLGGILGVLFSLFMAKKMRSVLGFRKMVIWGGLIYGLSYVSVGLNPGRSIVLLFISLLIVRSLGILMVDLTVKAYAVELYPDRSGWASGLTTAAYGAAAIVWAPLVTALITKVGNLSYTFLIIGAFLALIMLFSGSRLIEVPADFSSRFQRGVATQAPDRYYNVNRSQMVHLPVFYLLAVNLALAMASGNAILSQFAYYMEALLGTTAESAALAVSALALANMLGRILCGIVADRIGKVNTVLAIQVLSMVALIACIFISSPVLFTISSMAVIFSFGGMYCLLPPLAEEMFGHRHVTENFTILFALPNVAVVLGPILSSAIIDSTASLSLTMSACAAMAVISVAVMLLIAKKLRQVEAKNAETGI